MYNDNKNNILYYLEIIKKVLWLIPVFLISLFAISAITPIIDKNFQEPQHKNLKSDFIAVVHINSAIDQNFVDRTIGDINRVLNDNKLLGFLFIFNSPGGDPSASLNLMSFIKNLKNDYPVYGYINSTCTSGCYYSAISIDKIRTNKNSIVGSVGVLMQLIDFSKLSSKIGVNEKTLVVGDYKKPFSSFNGITPANEEYITQNMLTPVYNNFVDDVIFERDIEGKRDLIVDKYFNGKVFVGNDPVILNVLVDEVIDLPSFKLKIMSELGKTINDLNFIGVKKHSDFDIFDKIQQTLSPSSKSSYNLF